MIILLFVISLIVCIVIHELAHLCAAKLSKCKVEEFGIGFGKAIFQIKIKGTLYRLNRVLLGGYNKLREELTYSRSKTAFTSLRYRNKVLISLAGIVVNVVVGIVFYFLGTYIMNHCITDNQFFVGFSLCYFGILNFVLGITNLIPFPALDGSYPILVWLEKIYGKKKGYELMSKIVTKGMTILTELNKLTIIILVVVYRVQILHYIINMLISLVMILEKIKGRL